MSHIVRNPVFDAIEHLEKVVREAPAEKKDEIRVFLEGYLAAMEQEIRKRQ